MLYISISVTLITILATLHFLAKVKTENLGSFFKWIGNLVLLVATLILICQLARGVRKMMHHGNGGCNDMEQCDEQMGGKGGHMMIRKEIRMGGDGKCDEKMDCCMINMNCCEKAMECCKGGAMGEGKEGCSMHGKCPEGMNCKEGDMKMGDMKNCSMMKSDSLKKQK